MRAFAALALATGVLLSADARRPDFPPFVMRIEEWTAHATSKAGGETLAGRWTSRLEYHDRANWTLTVVAVSGAARGAGSTYRCDAGRYSVYEAITGWASASDDPLLCNGYGRWIHYGIAWSYHWARRVGPLPGQVTYEDPGERVVFDLPTGLPVRYEAGLTRSATPLETTDFVVERYGR